MMEQRLQAIETKIKDLAKRVSVLEDAKTEETLNNYLKMPWEGPPRRKEGN